MSRSLRPFSLVLLALLLVSAAALPASGGQTRVVHAPGTAAPSFVSGLATRVIKESPRDAALAHLRSSRYRIARPEPSLRLAEVLRRRDLVDVRFEQMHRGVPVWGAEYIVHLQRESDGYSATAVNGSFFTDLEVDVVPEFDAATARQLVDLRARTIQGRRLIPHGLTVLPYGQGVLAYHFSVVGTRFGRPVAYEVFLNALTGVVEAAYNNHQYDGAVTATGRTTHGEDVPLGAYERGGTYELRDQSKPMFAAAGGEITTHNVKGSADYLARPGNIATSSSTFFSGAATSSGAVDAHHGASLVYDFYRALGRESLDGAGMDIVSSVNAAEPNGAPMYNAFWDGINKQMVYGNPDPSNYHPFSAELDVVGHELTHGVTQHSGNLAYLGQSGAMNEAYSDYFGNAIDVIEAGTAMTDETAGYIGEDLCKTSQADFFPCPLRDLNDGTTTEDYIFFLADLDNGGVHLNSTIFGGALWDVRESLGADADRFIYRALTAYTTPLDDFVDGRNAVVQAATDLGASQDQIDRIEAAFDAHGIVEGWDAAIANDASVLMENVAPVSDLGFSPPALSGNRFVVADYGDKAQMCCVGLQIFSGTLDGDTRRVSAPDPRSDFTDETPDVSGDRVVWTRIRIAEGSAKGGRIVTRTIGGRETTIARGGYVSNPAIDGRLVAWESAGRNVDIRARYLGRKTKVVVGGRGDQVFPDVDGPWIAWWDARTQRIGVENFKSGRTRVVRPDDRSSFVGPPTVRGHHVYWFEVGAFDIRGSIVRMDLRSGRRQIVVPRRSEDAPVWALALTTPPIVSANDDHLVYSSELDYAREFGAFGRPGAVPNDEVGRDVFIVGVGGGATERVTTNRADQAFPLIGAGRRVVWLDSSEGRTDLVTRVVP